MANISLKNVTKVYRREYCAVDNLNLEIDDKEFVVIIGPSGSGKTAILRMLAGTEKVTSGEIYTLSLHDALPICASCRS